MTPRALAIAATLAAGCGHAERTRSDEAPRAARHAEAEGEAVFGPPPAGFPAGASVAVLEG